MHICMHLNDGHEIQVLTVLAHGPLHTMFCLTLQLGPLLHIYPVLDTAAPALATLSTNAPLHIYPQTLPASQS